MMTPVDLILEKLSSAQKTGNGWTARCPAHEDRSPSLSIREGDDGRALLKCHAGCSFQEICTAVGLTPAEMMSARDERPFHNHSSSKGRSGMEAHSKIVRTYNYQDETGKLIFQVVRMDPKTFRQRQPKLGGGWTWSVKGVRELPFQLPELLADGSLPVWITEGEKDVLNLARLGMLATCNAGGAGKWTSEHAEFLRGRDVIILPDNDEVGRKHAQQVALTLHGVAKSIRIVELPGLQEKGDVSEWIEAGGTKQKLQEYSQAADAWTPSSAQPWPDLATFDHQQLPEFPVDALPDVLKNWVKAESHATQTPADLAGLISIAVCSAAIARRVAVSPYEGWWEPVNLFVAVLLGPGNRKSAVFSDALRPLRLMEAELIEAAKSSVARDQSERRQKELLLKKLEKLAGEKDDPEARIQAVELAVQLAEAPRAITPRLIVDDATSEKLVTMLAEQGGRIASMSPEGGVFDMMGGKYSKDGSTQFDVYLMGHAGDDLTSDRISRESVRVERPALTCAYAIQPSVIQGLADNPAFRGRGLLARFLYASPPSWLGYRECKTEAVSEEVGRAYSKLVRNLAATEGQKILLLNREAQTVLHGWQTEVEEMMRDGRPLEDLKDWGSKLPGATVRIAAVMHCVQYGTKGMIEPQTVRQAIAVARYLIPHAEVVLTMMQAKESPQDGEAKYLLRWIERHNLKEFTKRDAHQHGKRKFPAAEDLLPAISELEKRGYIRLKSCVYSGPGRPASPLYEVNPLVFAKSKLQCSSQYPQNSRLSIKHVNFENSETRLIDGVGSKETGAIQSEQHSISFEDGKPCQ